MKKNGFTLIELMMVVVIIGLIMAIALPNLIRSRMTANEASATGAMRTISTGQASYQAAGVEATTNGVGKYGTLTSLGGANPPFVDVGLASGVKAGYVFSATPAIESNAVPRFTATASPASQDKTGFINYYVDESGVIRFEAGSAASSTSPPLN